MGREFGMGMRKSKCRHAFQLDGLRLPDNALLFSFDQEKVTQFIIILLITFCYCLHADKSA